MSIKSSSFALLLLVAAGTLHLAAAAPEGEAPGPESFDTNAFLGTDRIDVVEYGIRALVSFPKLDLRNRTSNRGVGGGVFVEKHFAESTIVQTRLDFISYPETHDLPVPNAFSFIPANSRSFAADSMALGVDVRQYLPLPDFPGLYVLAGVMGINYQFKTTYTGGLDQNGIPTTGLNTFKGKTSPRIGVALGLGYDFNGSVAFTVRYTNVVIDGTSFATVESGLSYRF